VAGKVSFRHVIQTGSGAHPASYPRNTRAFSLKVKQPEREADNSPPSGSEVEEFMELYIHSPTKPSWRGT